MLYLEQTPHVLTPLNNDGLDDAVLNSDYNDIPHSLLIH